MHCDSLCSGGWQVTYQATLFEFDEIDSDQIMLREKFEYLLAEILKGARDFYGERLVTLAVFGSVARGTARFDSDVDLLLICNSLPVGRLPRINEFGLLEDRLEPILLALQQQGISTSLSPMIKTPEEVQRGSPVFLDLVEDAQLLYDRDGFFAAFLDRLRDQLRKLAARRVWRGNAWYWDLKPDFKPGDVFKI